VNRAVLLVSLLIGMLVFCSLTPAKCLLMAVRVHGEVSGQLQEGDELLLRFVYSPKRTETSLAHPVSNKTFNLVAAYSTYKRRGVFGADVCGAAPHRIQLVMQDKNGVVLDTVDLTTPDEMAGVLELSYGNKQVVVIHRNSP
jgi:hypothetical protein